MIKNLINRLYKKYKLLQRKYFTFMGKFGLKSNQYYIVSFPKEDLKHFDSLNAGAMKLCGYESYMVDGL